MAIYAPHRDWDKPEYVAVVIEHYNPETRIVDICDEKYHRICSIDYLRADGGYEEIVVACNFPTEVND